MTATDVRLRPAGLLPAFFALTIFASAGLVFLVQPMVAKFALPLLGGSPSVWNTSMVFFQAALLAGYAYAHLLQRVRSLRTQAIIHAVLLLAAVLVLPLRVSDLVGPPSSNHPNLWLLAMLTVSIGPPFAMLSATAPLVQAWYARVFHAREGAEPYVLYAASNFGSLIALLGYPLLVEPALTLHSQSWSWSLGYAAFVLLMSALGLLASRGGPLAGAEAGPAPRSHGHATWRERLTWVALAAIPSSLMLGVTTHITTDVASAPFLWVLPLALYLCTFIVAFQARPVIPVQATLAVQALLLLVCAVFLPLKTSVFVLQLLVHLGTFFFTGLMCHQALVARRPPPERLTEFYLWMSVGGVVGGAFTALLAPVIFSNVWEYPVMLAASVLVRPRWNGGRTGLWRWALFYVAVVAAVAAPILDVVAWKVPFLLEHRDLLVFALLGTTVIFGFIIRRQRLLFFCVVIMLLSVAYVTGDRVDVRTSWRSFFGVVRQSETDVPRMGGKVRMLSHGTTLHGAQAEDPRWRCRPLVYYAPETPIGQVFLDYRARKPALTIGAVGLGTGAVAAYVRATDRLTFYEIDPLVIRISTDPKHFSYTTECAQGPIDFQLGDARLKLAEAPAGKYDILLIDAFSSDAVPVHLLTVEAVKTYLERLKPDGVLILHLSNRNLDLGPPAAGVAKAAGAVALFQHHTAAEDSPVLWESAEDALILAKSPEVLKRFVEDGRWSPPPQSKGLTWSDDYSNLIVPMYDRLKNRWEWLP